MPCCSGALGLLVSEILFLVLAHVSSWRLMSRVCMCVCVGDVGCEHTTCACVCVFLYMRWLANWVLEHSGGFCEPILSANTCFKQKVNITCRGCLYLCARVYVGECGSLSVSLCECACLLGCYKYEAWSCFFLVLTRCRTESQCHVSVWEWVCLCVCVVCSAMAVNICIIFSPHRQRPSPF